MVRLALFRDSGYKMLLQGGEVVNVEKKGHHSAEGLRHSAVGSSGRPGGYCGPGQFHGCNGFIPQNLGGRAMSALSRFGENAKMALDPMCMNQFQRNFETTGNKQVLFLHYGCYNFLLE